MREGYFQGERPARDEEDASRNRKVERAISAGVFSRPNSLEDSEGSAIEQSTSREEKVRLAKQRGYKVTFRRSSEPGRLDVRILKQDGTQVGEAFNISGENAPRVLGITQEAISSILFDVDLEDQMKETLLDNVRQRATEVAMRISRKWENVDWDLVENDPNPNLNQLRQIRRMDKPPATGVQQWFEGRVSEIERLIETDHARSKALRDFMEDLAHLERSVDLFSKQLPGH